MESVDHPSHYTAGDIECIDAIRSSMSKDEYVGYLKGNVIKYIWRYEKKNNPIEDLKKARWYLSRLVHFLEPANDISTAFRHAKTPTDDQESEMVNVTFDATPSFTAGIMNNIIDDFANKRPGGKHGE